ncbi:MAG: hypothetical protein ACJAYG_000490 [Oceanicoccus sp.]
MKLIKSVSSILLSGLLLITTNVQAEAAKSNAMDDQATSTVIVMRGLESSKTRSAKFKVFVGEESVGRIKVNTSKIVKLPAGEYRVFSSFHKDQPLEVSLEPGKTYYVLAKMEKVSGKIRSAYQLVSQEYAYNMMPELSGEAS